MGKCRWDWGKKVPRRKSRKYVLANVLVLIMIMMMTMMMMKKEFKTDNGLEI